MYVSEQTWASLAFLSLMLGGAVTGRVIGMATVDTGKRLARTVAYKGRHRRPI
jgi:hypothetical protein